MQILAYKPSHDGAVALLDNGELLLHIEAEKDSGIRYGEITAPDLMDVLLTLNRCPEVLAESGWCGRSGGYYGWNTNAGGLRDRRLMGSDVKFFTSSHERSHLMCAYGLSPFPQEQACYALLWEGLIGSFYEISPNAEVKQCWPILDGPGYRYAFAFFLADERRDGWFCGDLDLAGKMMALASFAEPRPPTFDESSMIDRLLQISVADLSHLGMNLPLCKRDWADSPFYNVGVESERFKNLAGQLHNRIYDVFHDKIRTLVSRRLPLLITGGCALNCEWNTRWMESGLFSDVFIPPCCNDSGSALGTAIDAQFHLNGSAKVAWSIDVGREFLMDDADLSDFTETDYSVDQLCNCLLDGGVIAWISGKYEMGPRALGHRSILAEPFHTDTRNRLNRIKGREDYRPVAPVCLEMELQAVGLDQKSPHMLFVGKVRAPGLKAVTHVDGTARAQTVNEQSHPLLAELLKAVQLKSGMGVLCNTSLNQKGRGFINRLSELVSFVRSRGLDGMVINGRMWLRRKSD